jgi:hypothetical protein
MLRLCVGAMALALATVPVPVAAQTSGQTGGSDKVTVPSGQSSGTGISGQPSTQSGQAAKPSDATGSVGMANEEQNEATRQLDSSKIPGKPGGKSGPAVKSPSKQQ